MLLATTTRYSVHDSPPTEKHAPGVKRTGSGLLLICLVDSDCGMFQKYDLRTTGNEENAMFDPVSKCASGGMYRPHSDSDRNAVQRESKKNALQ